MVSYVFCLLHQRAIDVTRVFVPLLFFTTIGFASAPTAAQELAETITGTAVATATDKIAIDGQQFMLWGIDSLDATQHFCRLNNRNWACRAVAVRALEILVDEGPVTCRRVDEPGLPGLAWAVCTVDGRDLAAELVRAGWAFAYRLQSDRYAAAENAARSERAGLWKAQFEFPWDWRDIWGYGEDER